MPPSRLIKDWGSAAGGRMLDDARAETYDLCQAAGMLYGHRPLLQKFGYDDSFHLENGELAFDMIRGFEIPYHGAGEMAVITEKDTGFRVVLMGEVVKRSFDHGITAFDLSETGYVGDIGRIASKLLRFWQTADVEGSFEMISGDVGIKCDKRENLRSVSYCVHEEPQTIKTSKYRAFSI